MERMLGLDQVPGRLDQAANIRLSAQILVPGDEVTKGDVAIALAA